MFSNKFSTINLTHLPYFVPVCQFPLECSVVLSVTVVESMVLVIQTQSFIVSSLLELFHPFETACLGLKL